MTTKDIQQHFVSEFNNGNFVTDKTGTSVIEMVGASFIADSPTIFGELNHEYIQHELDWYLSQSLNVNDIPGKVPAIWKSVATPAGFINSNYGYLVLSPKNHDQYVRVREELCASPTSRRAIMIYTRPSMHEDWNAGGMCDFICTNTVQYLIRDNKLHTVVNMRSNDIIFGYRNDYAWQKYIQGCLIEDIENRTGEKLIAGDITWQVGSLHMYSRHFNLLEKFILQDA